ncbi:uncharacterized protein I303_106123 [Kwoniella dejecticola CBS 10117]|uniref:WW domain-containing protein n=1 Tax=Kwoniella dejecticola CBS 10117 TaxID=1296121 RepID=A0A1A6A1C4_9TREE|nr:uncharacterized protein I303_06142 [Kwoniella dejecticola CBS 10117]OBR83859.1 hypothetical protein I303_06142 [Kwoniella dejecticola CBS 10117]
MSTNANPTEPPPPYQAGGARPNVSVTNPQGDVRSASSDAAQARPGHQRNMSNVSDVTDLTDEEEPKLDDKEIETRRSMDDEQRDLPEGWVRCFDPKQQHAFYVDERTKRSTWLHPYDDPEFLNSLPKDHPAHPDSKEGRAIRKQSEDEKILQEKYRNAKDSKGGKTPSSATQGQNQGAKGVVGAEERNWFQKKKDKLIGTKEERAKAKEEKRKAREVMQRQMREREAAYQKRRQELIQQRLNDPNIRRMYASDPYMYAAPSTPFMRGGGMYGSPYGYGYGGGYGRRYGGMGGMGMGAPLLMGGGAGLLGGMLMADAMTPDYGGGFGGGDFGGGGGGDFGGGGGGF